MIPNSGRIPACHCPKPELPCLPAQGLPFLLLLGPQPFQQLETAVGAPDLGAFILTLVPIQ